MLHTNFASGQATGYCISFSIRGVFSSFYFFYLSPRDSIVLLPATRSRHSHDARRHPELTSVVLHRAGPELARGNPRNSAPRLSQRREDVEEARGGVVVGSGCAETLAAAPQL